MTTETEILKLPEVLVLTKISRTSLYRFIQSGDFPRPIKLGPRARAWKKREILNWIANREVS